MNRVELIGRLTRNPELRYTSSNVAVANFSLAINRPYKKDEVQETDYINCKAFNKSAENINKYCNKGDLLGLEGRIQTRSYEKDDKKYYATEVIVENYYFLTPKKNEEIKKEEKVETPKQEETTNENVYEEFGMGNYDDDGIAF